MSPSFARRPVQSLAQYVVLACLLCSVSAAAVIASAELQSGEDSAASSSDSDSFSVAASEQSNLSASFIPEKVFHVGLVAKSPSHPLYGIGDADCYAIDGVAGGNITMFVGSSYAFQAMSLSPDYAMYISTSDIGGGVEQLSPHVFGDSTLLWKVTLPPQELLQGALNETTLRSSNSSTASNSSTLIQFISPVGLMRVTGRLPSAIEKMAANRTSSSRPIPLEQSSTASHLNVDALPLSDQMYQLTADEDNNTSTANPIAGAAEQQQPIASQHQSTQLHSTQHETS